jgi:catechol 2,3-dioxygenase-like lactoylglutathione lyase family enzyme
MRRGIALLLAALAAVALFAGLTHSVLVAGHVAEPAATTVQGLTSRRLWATTTVALALCGVVAGGLALARPARLRIATARFAALGALAAGLVAAVSGALVVAVATGGPGTGNGVVGGAGGLVLGLVALLLGGVTLARARRSSAAAFAATAAVVRYQVTDVARSLAFYTERLGFRPDPTPRSPMFASVVRGDLRLLLGGPGSSGSRPMPDGRRQEPGGWNRIVLYVSDLSPIVAALREAGVRFRNDVESGPGGSQIQIEDPDGNPIELHESPTGFGPPSAPAKYNLDVI